MCKLKGNVQVKRKWADYKKMSRLKGMSKLKENVQIKREWAD